MKLRFDQNLSRHLVEHLRDAFPESEHVSALGLDAVTDEEIWEFAREHGHLIVSKDPDFRQLAFLHGPPPKALWLRGTRRRRRHRRAARRRQLRRGPAPGQHGLEAGESG